MHDNFAEQVGWPELVAQVAGIYRALPPDERAHTGIWANNYGEAGALDHYGPAYGLPRVISPVNSFWARGYGDPPPTTLIVLGDDREGIADAPATCVAVARVRNRDRVVNEETRGRAEIFLCRNLRVDWPRIWAQSRRFG